MYLFRKTSIALLCLSLFTVSCLRSPREAEENNDGVENTADFKALEVTGKSFPVTDGISWNIPIKMDYEFRVCLISRATKSPLPSGQRFLVEMTDKSSLPGVTDNLGCLVWKEPIPFNYSGDSAYFEIVRKITGKGTHKGIQTLRLAVNPWKKYRNDEGAEIIDLNRGSKEDPLVAKSLVSELAKDAMAEGLVGRSSGHQLLIERNPTLTIFSERDTPNGKLLNVTLRMHPYIEPLNLQGEKVTTPLVSGKFKVYAQIVADNLPGLEGDQVYSKPLILTPELAVKSVEIKNGNLLNFQISTPLSRKVSVGQLKLALKIVPENAPFDLIPYEGLHKIGTFKEIYANGPVEQIQGGFSERGFNYEHFVKGSANFEDILNASWVKKLKPVNYDNLNPRFVRVKSDETATERNIIYRVSTRVTDTVTGSPVEDQDFIVKRDDGAEITVTSDHNGLLQWTNVIHHHYYQPEQFYMRNVEITHKVSGGKATHTIGLNPWDSGWTFGRDEREREYGFNDAELGKKKLKAPLLMVDAFRYQTIRFRYVIDEFLTLNVKKAVVMALDPLVQKISINNGRKFEPLRDGVYLAKIALVKYYMDPFQNGVQLLKDEKDGHSLHRVSEGEISDVKDARKGRYTTIVKKLLRVQAGRITTPLEFSMRDLRMMSIRSNIMVQIETIDERLLLEDNLIYEKLTQLENDYELYQGMTEEEKEAFLAKREETYKEEIEKLKNTIGKELEDIQRRRAEVSDLMEQRHNELSQLEDSLADKATMAAAISSRETFNLPRGEFEDMIARARENQGVMAQNMKRYWESEDASWISEQRDLHSKDPLVSVERVSVNSPRTRKGEEALSYLSYLSNMRSFLNENHLEGIGLTSRDVQRLEDNNYTENPAAPLVDLNLYRNGDVSGLKKRTFIGPCTLVENDNMSEMRPTDTIDEKACEYIDCHDDVDDAEETKQTVDNSEFEDSKHHDSLKPFANRDVDYFVPIHKENEINYRRKMKALSQMGNFVATYNLNYVSLENKPLKQYIDGCTFETDKECFKESSENVILANNFLGLLQTTSFEELLQHYFYVNSLSDLRKANDEAERLLEDSPNKLDTLEPMFDRVIRESKGILSGLGERLKSPYISGRSAIGTTYYSEKVRFMNDKYDDEVPSLGKADIRRWLHEGLDGVKLKDALRICDALSTQAVTSLKSENLFADKSFFSGDPEKRAHQYLLEECFKSVKYLPNNDKVYFSGITFDRRYRIIETGPYEHKAGKNMNLNVGIDFGIYGYNDVQSVASVGGSGIALLGIAAAGVAAVATGGLSVAVAAGLAGLASSGVIMYSGSVNSVAGTMKMQTTGVNAATFLVVQQADMDIQIERHEKCLVTQFSPSVIENMDPRKLALKDGLKIRTTLLAQKELKNDNERVARTLSRGFVVCDGVETKERETISESYYYVTQHFTAGDMLDDVNLLNHVWLLALRGKRDFNTFLGMTKGRQIGKDGEVIANENLYDYSLSRLGKVYKQVVPTFPGMFSAPD